MGEQNPRQTVAQAGEDLDRLTAALRSLAEDLFTPPWAPESGRASSDYRRIPWSGAEPVQRAYLEISDHVARAHWDLERDTDVEELWLVPWAQPGVAEWKDLDLRVPTIPLDQATLMCALLRRALQGLEAQWDHLLPQEQNAAYSASGHVMGAMACVPDGFGDKQATVDGRRCRVDHCHRLAEPDRRECATCRGQRRRAA